MTYDSRPDTWAHIHQVRKNLTQVIKDLLKRAEEHDLSKLEEPELSVFDEFSMKLKKSTYNSEEYKEFLRIMQEGTVPGRLGGLAHHYAVEDHHPEHFIGPAPSGVRLDVLKSRQMQGEMELGPGRTGIHGMNLVQMIEMLADWKAATMRHDDGNLYKSIFENQERFGYGDEIRALLLHTAAYFGWL